MVFRALFRAAGINAGFSATNVTIIGGCRISVVRCAFSSRSDRSATFSVLFRRSFQRDFRSGGVIR